MQSLPAKWFGVFAFLALLVVRSHASAAGSSSAPGQPLVADPRTYTADLVRVMETDWPHNRIINIVCHGHSVPAGYFKTPVLDTFNAYPHLLHRALAERYPHAQINVIVTAIGGENSPSGAARFDRDVLALHPDVITIDYCLNDRGLGLEAAKAAWSSMIEKAQAAGVKVILLTPTNDTTARLDSPDDPLCQHAEQVRALAGKYRVGLVDSLAAFKRTIAAGAKPDDLMSQINHPNRKGHQLVADELIRWFPSSASVTSQPAARETVAVETYARRTYNYLDNMTDKDGLPYFNIFWSEPAEAAHDWPDFGDVTSRQLQATVMARHMTGQTARWETGWCKQVLARLDPQTGLLMRPKTSYCDPGADLGDQELTLYALATLYLDNKDPALRAAACKMVDHMSSLYTPDHWLRGFGIKTLMVCARRMDYPAAAEQAGRMVKSVFEEHPLFNADNTFDGHMHAHLRTLVGTADYALYTKDAALLARVDASYKFVRSISTKFGFLPEVVGRKGDVVSCETCALMDYVGVGVTLANHGHPGYWGDVERTFRNQLIESQITDGSWLKSGDKPDTEQFTWRDIGDRMVGGYAGWSSPTHILAAREDLHWGGPELAGKTRATQNCCGGSGTHGFFIVWKNCSRFENGVLSVNMHIDKLLPQAEIRCYQPYRGLLTIDVKEPCKVRVRIPDFTDAAQMTAKSATGEIKTQVAGGYLELGDRRPGEKLEISYPLPIRDEEETVGNPGFRQYKYRVIWKGDTVVRMTPVGDVPAKVFSDFDKKEVPVFYGIDGPGPLYQREYMLKDGDVQPAALQMDDGSLDFWFLK